MLQADLSGGYQLYNVRQALKEHNVSLGKKDTESEAKADIVFTVEYGGGMVSAEVPNPTFWFIPYAAKIRVTFNGSDENLAILKTVLSNLKIKTD